MKTGILLSEPVLEGQKEGLKIFLILFALSMTSLFENELDKFFNFISIICAISRYCHASSRSPPDKYMDSVRGFIEDGIY
jgi:hypothetical protein